VNLPRTLVVFFSQSGNTRRIGLQIAAGLDADVEDLLEDTRRRRGLLGFIQGAYQALRGRATTLRPTRHDPASYDLVIIGTPVWSDSVTPAVRAYLAARRGALRSAAFYLTYGSSGKRRVFDQLETLSGKRPLATAAVKEAQMGTAEADRIVADLVAKLRPPVVQHAAAPSA
jgi:flavodoxin